MASRWLRALSALDLEERILNGAALLAAVGVFLPWISGEWLGGDPVSYSGFSFYTSFLGLAVFLLHFFVILVTMVPLFGGPTLVRRRHLDAVRFAATAQATILILGALSVLTKVTFEFSRIEIRLGIYVALVGSLIATLYAFIKWQQQRRQAVQDVFRHPDDAAPAAENASLRPSVPPPPPPPPPAPEDHHLHP